MDTLYQQHVENLAAPVSEMEIVDTFTHMIFEDEAISSRELRIIHALSEVDPNVTLDSFAEIGAYLRALGVEEMIKLVSRVRYWLSEHEPVPLDNSSGVHPATLRRH